MGLGKKIGGWFGVTSKGKSLSTEERATEDKIQQSIDKLSTGSKEFGNRSLSAKDAEAELRAQGVLPQGWRLRKSDSTSSGYRPTQAASKKMGALHAGMVGAAALTGGAALGVGPLAGLSGLASTATGAGIQGGLGAAQGAATGGLKGALTGGAIGAASGFVPGAGGVGGTATSLGKQVALQGGLGAAQGLASGGGWKGALRGGAVGAGGALAPKVAPALTKSGLGQKAINVGLNAGLNTAATGRFDAKGTGLAAGSAFLPDATKGLSNNPTAQKWTNFAGNQALNTVGTGRFNPVQAGVGALNVANPNQGRVMNSLNQYAPAASNIYNNFMPRSQQGQSTWESPGLGVNPKATYSGSGNNIVEGDDPSGTGGGGGWVDKYGPLIAQGGGLVAGAYAGRKATDMAMARSPEELAALRGASGAAGAQGRYGSQILGQGQGDTTQARNYYSKLLTGNRALQTQAVAPGIASVTDAYRGAARGLDQTGVRGASRDVANADLARARASHIAGLTTGVQPMAAEALSKMGATQTATGGQLLGNAGNLYGNLLGQGTLNRKYGREEGEKTSKAIGQLSRDVGEVIGGKGKKPGGGKAPTVTTPGKDWGVYDPSRTPAPQIPTTGNPSGGSGLPGYVPQVVQQNPYGLPGWEDKPF